MQKSKRTIPGINIQEPWARLLLSGDKTVETRSYPLPKSYRSKEIAVIETSGKSGGKGKPARIIGTIVFKGSFLYSNESEWRKDSKRHLVKSDDPVFGFKRDKPKWGWEVESVVMLAKPVVFRGTKGIIYAKACEIPTT